MSNLQEILLARLAADPRAHIGAIDVQEGQLRLTFGAIGFNPRVVLAISGNQVKVISPEVPADQPRRRRDAEGAKTKIEG